MHKYRNRVANSPRKDRLSQYLNGVLTNRPNLSTKAPESPSVSTFKSLMNKTTTIPDFVTDPLKVGTKSSFVRKRSRFVALELIALWIPRAENDVLSNALHFIYDQNRDIMVSNLNYPAVSSEKFFTVDPLFIQEAFINSSPRHLGSLIFLNFLLEGDLQDDSLHLSKDFLDNKYYFVQYPYNDFFKNFLGKSAVGERKFDIMSVINSSQYKEWWRKVIPDSVEDDYVENYLSDLYLKEIFATVLRVYLTPSRIVRQISLALLGDKYNYNDFISYLIDIKESVVSSFLPYLTESQESLWKSFIADEAISVYKSLKQDLNELLRNFNYNQMGEYHCETQLELLMNGAWLNIPGLLDTCRPNAVRKRFTSSEKALEVSCIFGLIESNWHKLGRFSDHDLWRHLDNMCKTLHSDLTKDGLCLENESSEQGHNLVSAIMMAACRFKYNNVCRFLLLHYPFLINWHITNNDFLIPPYNIFKHLTLKNYALQNNNEIVAEYIDSAVNTTLSDRDDSLEDNPPSQDITSRDMERKGSFSRSGLIDDLPFAIPRRRRQRSRSFHSFEDFSSQHQNDTPVCSSIAQPAITASDFPNSMFSSDSKEQVAPSLLPQGSIIFPALVGDDKDCKEGGEPTSLDQESFSVYGNT